MLQHSRRTFLTGALGASTAVAAPALLTGRGGSARAEDGPPRFWEAAIVDGCGSWRGYWSVVLPLSRPIMSALSVFFFLANWNAFIWPLIVTSDEKLQVVQIGISSFQTPYAANGNYVLAAAVVAAVPTLVLSFVFQRRIVESIKTSGLRQDD